MAPEQIIVDEFCAWYLGDEMLIDDVFMDQLPAMAARSAVRMASAAGPDGVGAVIELLDKARDDRSHPLLATIGRRTLFDWTADDEVFSVFQHLVDLMVSSLRAGPVTQSVTDIVWDYGTEFDPVSSVGRLTVTLRVDGVVRLDQHARGRHRIWHARQAEGVWAFALSLLVKARFPTRPLVSAPTTPGISNFAISRRMSNGGLTRVELPTGIAIPGYDEVNAMMFSIVAQMNPHILGFQPPLGPAVVTDVHPDRSNPAPFRFRVIEAKKEARVITVEGVVEEGTVDAATPAKALTRRGEYPLSIKTVAPASVAGRITLGIDDYAGTVEMLVGATLVD